MKVAFVGKGGSGKTTLASLFARYLTSQKLPVLAIDADINQHLAMSLGYDGALPPMGMEIERIKAALKGSNKRISSLNSMAKTTPPATGSQLVRLGTDNSIFDYFARQIDGVQLMATGPFSEEDLGVKCYHSKTGAVELLLNHLIDDKNEYVLVDMTAGADSFASGMFTRFDITFIVVEPTLKSLLVYEQYKRYAADYDVKLAVIGNKIDDTDDVAFLEKHTGADYLAGFGQSAFVKKTERGQHLSINQLEPANIAVLKQMKETVDGLKKNWQKYYEQAVEFHIKNANSWANEAAGEDLTKQIEPDFSLEKAVKQILVSAK